MRPEFFHRFSRQTRTILAAGAVAFAGLGGAQAEPMHGIAMYGEPALPADFTHLPQANPGAPKGGRIVFAESGSFDSLNPVIRKGRAPWQLPYMIFETLMGRSYDDPSRFTGYWPRASRPRRTAPGWSSPCARRPAFPTAAR